MNVYKRGKTWTYIVEGPRKDGKRNRITKGGFKTKRECEKEAIALEHELNISNINYRDNQIYYVDLAEEFLEYHKNNVRETTFFSSTYQVSYSMEFFKDYIIKDIKVLDLQNFVNSLELSPSTIKLVFNKVKQIFSFGIDIAEIINYEPNFKKVILPTINSKVRNDILTGNDINTLLDDYKNTIYYYVFQTAINTGMRRGEILALTWDKIDFGNNIIIVDKNLTRFNKITLPKNNSSIRQVPMNSNLKKILLELKKFTKNKVYYSLKGEDIILSEENNFDFLFRNEYGEFINGSDINSIFGNHYKYKYHFHQFRHYFATKLINAGIPVAEVAKILGHAQVSTTLKMYVGTNKSENLTNKLDAIFGQQMDNK
ncbi:MAG: tyrosine-type recombinase/integrase [Peptoniphilaceae bacterium]|nr:tyrosine-type recombinase/integrase [Peptoniphilaceae bacterium]